MVGNETKVDNAVALGAQNLTLDILILLVIHSFVSIPPPSTRLRNMTAQLAGR